MIIAFPPVKGLSLYCIAPPLVGVAPSFLATHKG